MRLPLVSKIALAGIALVALAAACGSEPGGGGGGTTTAATGNGGSHAKLDGGVGGIDKEPPTSGAGW
jgi:hypothetical protein